MLRDIRPGSRQLSWVTRNTFATMAEKLYCYADETGLDTQGELFIVSVVVTGAEREQIIQLCEEIEQATGKGRVKWVKARYDRRLAYIQRILQEPILQGKLHFAIYRDTEDYLTLTVQTIASSIRTHARQSYKATVLRWAATFSNKRSRKTTATLGHSDQKGSRNQKGRKRCSDPAGRRVMWTCSGGD